jgi:hypothetical protein
MLRSFLFLAGALFPRADQQQDLAEKSKTSGLVYGFNGTSGIIWGIFKRDPPRSQPPTALSGKNIFNAWMFGCMGIGSLAVGMYFLRDLLRNYRSKKWPTTIGRIRSIDVEKAETYRMGISYIPVIAYTYSVGDQSYDGDLLTFSGIGYTEQAKAWAFLEKYQHSTQVEVHYDPRNPKQSVLEAGKYQGSLYGMVILFCGVGLTLLMMSILSIYVEEP